MGKTIYKSYKCHTKTVVVQRKAIGRLVRVLSIRLRGHAPFLRAAKRHCHVLLITFGWLGHPLAQTVVTNDG
jgi:hypothetical protein